MKILLVSGHTSGYNASSVTGVNEGDLNIDLVKLLDMHLSHFAEVDVYPYYRDMYRDNRDGKCQVNMAAYDYIFEVHFNAFNGKARGSGIHIHSKYKGGISVEQTVINKLCSFGFSKRGDKGIVRRSDLLNMNKAYQLGVDYALIEVCFYDNVEDMNIYKANKTGIASAIASGIIQGFGLDDGNTKINDGNFKVKIIADELNIREGAGVEHEVVGKFVDKDKVSGSCYEKGVYTIVKTATANDGGTWGKLKSGVGWINISPKYVIRVK